MWKWKSSSGRTLLSSWWIFCIVTVAIYSANFVAFFTVTKDEAPIKSLEQLISQTNYKWGTNAGTVFETNFKVSISFLLFDIFCHQAAILQS